MSAGNARHTSPPTAAAAPTRGDLWRLRLLYMMVFASYGTTGVYRSLYFRRVGLDDLQIGALIAIMPLAMLISGPLWSI
ncbi:MAG: MFS transporter, partial [Chloroflexota bacterium]